MRPQQARGRRQIKQARRNQSPGQHQLTNKAPAPVQALQNHLPMHISYVIDASTSAGYPLLDPIHAPYPPATTLYQGHSDP